MNKNHELSILWTEKHNFWIELVMIRKFYQGIWILLENNYIFSWEGISTRRNL